jgi:regulator of replication initiation timing
MSGLESFVARAAVAEKEIEKLMLEVEALKATNVDYDEKVPEDLEKLRIENSKLKYRLGILKRATEAQRKRN